MIFLLSYPLAVGSEERGKNPQKTVKGSKVSRGENHPFSWRSNQKQTENGVLQVNPLFKLISFWLATISHNLLGADWISLDLLKTMSWERKVYLFQQIHLIWRHQRKVKWGKKFKNRKSYGNCEDYFCLQIQKLLSLVKSCLTGKFCAFSGWINHAETYTRGLVALRRVNGGKAQKGQKSSESLKSFQKLAKLQVNLSFFTLFASLPFRKMALQSFG